MNITDIATIASALFAGCSALIAAWAVYVPSKNQHDQKLLEEAVLSLERAYSALNEGSKPEEPPKSSHWNWLACADHLQRFKSLKTRMTVELYMDLCNGHERYWRDRFHRRIYSSLAEANSYYYERLDSQSVFVVYDFVFVSDGEPKINFDVNVDRVLNRMPRWLANPVREHLQRRPGSRG